MDTGNSLYTNLLSVWAFLEGSGTSTADSKGSNTGTLSDAALWSTDANGPIIHNTSALTARPVAVTQFTLGDGTQNFSIAFGALQTSDGDSGMVMGDPDTVNNYIWLRGSNYLRIQPASINFTSQTSFTTYADYVLTFEYVPGVSNLWRLYKNGTITADSPISQGGTINIDALCGGFTALSLVGDLSYVYIWLGRTLTGAEAATLASNPYSIFLSGGGATLAPQRLLQGVGK